MIPQDLDTMDLNKKEIIGGSETSSNTSTFRTGSTFGAYLNIVCVVAGTGTLGLPYTLHQGGWIVLGLFIVTAIIALFNCRYLIESLYCKESERLNELYDVGEVAFGKVGRYSIKFFQYCISLSSPCIYILLSGLNTYQVVLQLNNGVEILSKDSWIIISGIIIAVPFCLMKTLKEVTILAVFGVLTTILVILLVIIFGAIQFNSIEFIAPNTSFVKWEGVPIALTTTAFSYGGNVVYPQVEATMKHPQHWGRAMLLAMITITVMYISISVPGYFFYGDNVASPILDSLPKGAGSLAAYFLITAHVLLAAPIYLCTFAVEQETWLNINRTNMSANKEFLIRVVLRSSIALVLTVIALFLPYFSDLMSLIGAVASCLIVFVIPIACHYKVFGWRARPIWHHFMSVLSILMGCMGLILGSISAMNTLIDHIQNGQSDVVHH